MKYGYSFFVIRMHFAVSVSSAEARVIENSLSWSGDGETTTLDFARAATNQEMTKKSQQSKNITQMLCEYEKNKQQLFTE